MIEINNLTKNYGKSLGVKNLNFKLEKGKLHGFVGPNGAGKSTTIKILLGFIFKDSGSAYINGLDVEKDSKKIKQITGYSPAENRLYDNLYVKELFKLNKMYYKTQQLDKELNRLVDLFELNVNKKINELSSGNKKKVSLILAMIFNPKVLILDEPTNGLDPIIQERFFKELKDRTKKGVTILLSSHNLSEIERYADNIIFINEGKILKEKSNIKLSNYKIVTITKGNISHIKTQNIICSSKNKTTFKFEGKTKDLLSLLSKIKPDDIIIENPNLTDYFKNIFDGDLK